MIRHICNVTFKWAGGGSPLINWEGDFAPTLAPPWLYINHSTFAKSLCTIVQLNLFTEHLSASFLRVKNLDEAFFKTSLGLKIWMRISSWTSLGRQCLHRWINISYWFLVQVAARICQSDRIPTVTIALKKRSRMSRQRVSVFGSFQFRFSCDSSCSAFSRLSFLRFFKWCSPFGLVGSSHR